MTWGAFVIVASIIGANGQQVYEPTTRFDEAACAKEMAQINREWAQQGIIGLATCRRMDDE
jgi:hypothetical protein